MELVTFINCLKYRSQGARYLNPTCFGIIFRALFADDMHDVVFLVELFQFGRNSCRLSFSSSLSVFLIGILHGIQVLFVHHTVCTTGQALTLCCSTPLFNVTSQNACIAELIFVIIDSYDNSYFDPKSYLCRRIKTHSYTLPQNAVSVYTCTHYLH